MTSRVNEWDLVGVHIQPVSADRGLQRVRDNNTQMVPSFCPDFRAHQSQSHATVPPCAAVRGWLQSLQTKFGSDLLVPHVQRTTGSWQGLRGVVAQTHPESQWTRRRPVVLLDRALKHATGHKDDGNEHEDDGFFFCTLAMFAKTSRKGDQGNRRRDLSQTISGIRCPLHRQGVVC